MRPRWLLAGLLALGSLPGCPRAPELPAERSAPSRAAIPLWDLAPAGANFGVVVHDGAAAAIAALLPFAEGGPLQELAAQLVGEISSELPLNLVAARSWAEIGLDPSRGAALFSPAGAGSSLFVLPVGDRARFREAARAQVKRRGGREVDEIGRGYVCAEAEGRYLCARTIQAIDRAIAPHDAELTRAIRAMRAIAPSMRGAIEVYADAKAFEMQPITSELRPIGEVSAGSLSLRLGPGSVEIDAHLSGEMKTFLAEGLYGAPPQRGLAEGLLAAPTALRLRVPPTLLVARALPSSDAELAAALLEQLEGDVELITRGTGPLAFSLMFPLRDPAPVEARLPSLCASLFSGLERFGAKALSGEACSGVIEPRSHGLSLFSAPLPVRVGIEGRRLVLQVGARDEAPRPPDEHHASRAAQRALLGPESFAIHARSLQLGPAVGAEDALRGALPFLDAQSLASIEAWNRLGARIDEATIHGRLGAEALHLELSVRTFGDDAPEARVAYEAALSRRFAGDEAGYRAAMAELPLRFPGSRVGQRALREQRGGPWLGAGALLLAGLAFLERR